jgi:hypothetical protein
MNDIYIFAGPSLSGRHATDLANNCTVLPPVIRGDINQLIAEKGKPGTIAVIDGYFDDELAVSHQELCAALDQGWQIWGMSGMGAIRAYELRYEGMRGYGRVYDYFKKRADFRDDEVACLHDVQPPYQTHSEPMVHLREAINWLVQSGGLAASEGRRVTKALEQMWFANRTIDRFLELLRDCSPPVSEDNINAMLNDFSKFQIKLRDVDNFLSNQPWQNKI